MNDRTLELLEYEALRSLLGRYVSGELGRRRLEAMTPSTDRSFLEAELAEAEEACRYWRAATRGEVQTPGLAGLPNVAEAAARLRIAGAGLDAEEILAVLALLARAQDLRHALLVQAAAYPLLAKRCAALADFRPLLRDLEGKILPGGRLADHASVALGRIRRDLERKKKDLQETLERFLRRHRDDGVLQEEFVTLRNDRFVVPVVPGAKRKVEGVVHGASGSGQTLFVEPLEALELNNDLVRLREEELREEHRILMEMTSRLHESAGEILTAVEVTGALDFLFAKGRFAQEFDAIIPRLSPEDRPRLYCDEARHPLLTDILRRQRKRVVPLKLELTATQGMLLISGPNTGGKTVAMKTVGLLALMAQSGLPVPALEAEFPIFPDVLADIGDQQSLEQSLSSFSAHVARLREMIEAAAPGCLVLLDEIGRATDPEEGGALAVAVLDEFRHRGAFTFASTHLMALKVYGANTPGVVNASMGFNDETLEPTYVLKTGAPGKSAGLDIAARLGLPAHLIERARRAMTTSEREINEMLASLERKIQEANEAGMALARQELALKEREKRMEADTAKARAVKMRELEERAERALNLFEKQAQAVIEEVLSAPEQRKQAEKALRKVATVKRELRESIAEPRLAAAGPLPELREGVKVKLRDVSGPATVRRIVNAELIEVEVGLLKMQVARSEVLEVLTAAEAAKKNLPAGVSFKPAERSESLTRELNLIGKTSAEAQGEIERFLDTAMLAEVFRVRIVHGHGTGVLRRLVQEMLSTHPAVASFHAAPPAEGGAGATIVELR